MSFLALALVAALSQACAPNVAPETLVSIARVESALNPLALGVNGGGAHALAPRSISEAVATAERLETEGRDIDVGLAQINVRTLRRLGIPVREAFDPCLNLAIAGAVLSGNYRSAGIAGGPRAALRRALSLYNTGSATRGLRNGYVARVERAALELRAPLRKLHLTAFQAGHSSAAVAAAAPPRAPPEEVFAASASDPGPAHILVFS